MVLFYFIITPGFDKNFVKMSKNESATFKKIKCLGNTFYSIISDYRL